MPREQFLYDGTKELCDLIDRAGHRAGFGRGQAFEDFLTLTVCTLATGLMEDEYLATVRKGYDKGEKGSRGIDYISQAFAGLVMLMDDNRDYLGDLFCGGISYGQRGEFFTPESLTTLMAELLTDEDSNSETDLPPPEAFADSSNNARETTGLARPEIAARRQRTARPPQMKI